MLRGLGAPDGRRTRQPQPLPNLGRMPWTSLQKAVMDARARTLLAASPFIHPNLSLFNPPADADTFYISSAPAAAYPQPGQSAVTVLTYVVPRSKLAVIQRLAVIHVGGNAPDFTGQVIWRVKKNGGGLRGLAGITAQVGTQSNPLPVTLIGVENDTFTVTAEVPVTWAAMPAGATTAALFVGFTYPLSEATNPQPGSY
jgi:hypothetical protein